MENKKQGGTPKDCESLRFFISDKENRLKVTVHGKYEKGNQYEMYFEKQITPLSERVPQHQAEKSSILGLSKGFMLDESNKNKEEDQTAQLGSYIAKPWIEKYKPSKVYELLAPENLVRQLLMWLKGWDEQITKTKKKNGFQKKQNTKNEKQDDKAFKPVMLLSGPTGIGKTAIATLTTKQIGFKSTIITPSTARTAERMVELVKNITQTHRIDSVTGAIEKGALIVDELETASEHEVKQLHKALFEKGKLRRPVICICINPLLPSLKDIREKSERIHVYENQQDKLLTFLKGVCKKELILVDQIYLLDIMNFLEGDIRLCLEALQQLHQRGRKVTGGGVRLTYKDIEAMDFEKVRDKFSSAGSILKGIMLKPSTSNPSSQLLRIKDLDSQIGSLSEVSKITEGLYTNLFLESKSVSRGLELVSSFLDRLSSSNEFIEGQQFGMLSYMKTPIYDYCYKFNKAKPMTKLERKRLYFDMKAEQTMYESIVQDFNSGLSSQDFVQEVGPGLFKALQPSLRFASTHLFNETEHREMKQVVGLMKRYKVSLNPEAKLGPVEGGPPLVERPIWKPPLHRLVSFLTSDSHSITLTNNERKLILFDYPMLMDREEKKKKREEAITEVKKSRPTLSKMGNEANKLMKEDQVFNFEWIEGNHQILREKKANTLFSWPVHTHSVMDYLLPLRRKFEEF